MARSTSSDPPTHTKLHRRGNSSPSIGSPVSPRSPIESWNKLNAFEQAWSENNGVELAAPKAVKIKPYLRKFSVKENSGGIDLSRPAAENEGFTGLGIEQMGMGPRTVSDVTFAPIGARTQHHRSTSNTSQFSNSSASRPSLPYVHPMRQTPRPYTPPIAHTNSYANSSVGPEDEAEADDIAPEEIRYRSNMDRRRSGSISSGSVPPSQLALNTSRSFTKLATHSQSSLSVTSPIIGRARGDTLRSVDTNATSPSSRPSLDKFNFIRGRDSPMDPVARQNEIRLARQAYREKEEAKDRKAEKEALKQADRDARKVEKREERQRRKEDSQHKRSVSISNEKLDSTSVVGREYAGYRPAHERSMPLRVETGTKRTYTAPDISKTKRARSRWLAFITWFRTRLLRMGHRKTRR